MKFPLKMVLADIILGIDLLQRHFREILNHVERAQIAHHV